MFATGNIFAQFSKSDWRQAFKAARDAFEARNAQADTTASTDTTSTTAPATAAADPAPSVTAAPAPTEASDPVTKPAQPLVQIEAVVDSAAAPLKQAVEEGVEQVVDRTKEIMSGILAKPLKPEVSDLETETVVADEEAGVVEDKVRADEYARRAAIDAQAAQQTQALIDGMGQGSYAKISGGDSASADLYAPVRSAAEFDRQPLDQNA